MLTIIYEDAHLIVVKKPIGMESQSSRGFSADMVSEIKKHIHKTSTALSTDLSTKRFSGTGQRQPSPFHKQTPDIYVGVIHRLDKPVGGLMVYAKTRQAAAVLSKAVQNHQLKKQYLAILCGKPVDNVGNYVDYLVKPSGENHSAIVDETHPLWTTEAKRAELSYRVIAARQWEGHELTLAEVDLLTGRHHQIRVQFAGRGTPLWGDNRYHPEFVKKNGTNVALAAWRLSFAHPITGKKLQFELLPEEGIFQKFQDILIEYKRSTNQK